MLSLVYGKLALQSLQVSVGKHINSVDLRIGKRSVPVQRNGRDGYLTLRFKPQEIHAGEQLTLTIHER